MTASARPGLVAEALSLRAWAFPVLSHNTAADGWRDAPPVGQAAWALFLAGEGCASPLRARLGPIADGALPAATVAVVEARLLQEQRRFLSAAAQVRQLARWLGDRTWVVVVLKGGVAAAASPEPVDVLDLDLLVHPDHAGELAALLEERGGYASLGDEAPGSESRHKHLPQRLAPGSVQVEVHRFIPGLAPTADLLERAVRLGADARLCRLAPADHLWHLLTHGAVHHLDRRGKLREWVVLQGAVAACTPPDLDVVRGWIVAHPHAAPLSEVLAFALAGAGGGDPFVAHAALRYTLGLRGPGRRLSRRLAQNVTDTAFALLDERGVRGYIGTVLGAGAGERARAFPWLPRAVAAAASTAWRAARLSAAAVVALPLAWRARRAVRIHRASLTLAPPAS